MSEFNKEHRYWVFKKKHLTTDEDTDLSVMARAMTDECLPTCVVVEEDWPEYEIVWEMIQARVEGRPNEIAELQVENKAKDEEIAALQSQVPKWVSVEDRLPDMGEPNLEWIDHPDADEISVHVGDGCQFHAYHTYWPAKYWRVLKIPDEYTAQPPVEGE